MGGSAYVVAVDGARDHVDYAEARLADLERRWEPVPRHQ